MVLAPLLREQLSASPSSLFSTWITSDGCSVFLQGEVLEMMVMETKCKGLKNIVIKSRGLNNPTRREIRFHKQPSLSFFAMIISPETITLHIIKYRAEYKMILKTFSAFHLPRGNHFLFSV